MANSYTNGIGGTLGDSLVTRKPILASGAVWYVRTSFGTDAASPAGRNRSKPLLTLAQAITNAANDDIIVLLDGFTETLTAAQTISKRLTIVGEGLSEGKPTCKLSLDASSGNLLTISGVGVQLRNIWFEGNVQANASARISVTGAGFRMIGCYVECGQYDTGAALSLGSGADYAELKNTTFISTAIGVAAQPESAITVAAAISQLRLDSLVLSDGSVGFSNYFAFDGGAAAITGLMAENVSLLLGADMELHASTTGYLNVQTSTSGGRVQW